MGNVFFSDWASVIRTIVAGVCSYVLLVALLRVSGKRTLSKMNAFDLVVTVALGSTLATILVSKELSVATGFAGLAILVGLQYAIACLSTRSKLIRQISRSEPRLLVRNGELLHRAIRQERVDESEVMAALRKHGIPNLSLADAVILETDGTFSVIESDRAGPGSTLAPVGGATEKQPEPER
jgi:uncharacterized membrane protein YcaP (DUF421 family)